MILKLVWTVTLDLARLPQHESSFVQLGLMPPRTTSDYAYLLHVFVYRFGFNHPGPLGITLTVNRALFSHAFIVNRFSMTVCTCITSCHPSPVTGQVRKYKTRSGAFDLSADADAKVCFFLYVAMVPRDHSLN